MGPSGRIAYIELLGQVNVGLIQELYLGRAPRTKETLPDFLKWRRVTRPPLVFRGLTGSQRTPGFWGVTATSPVGSGNYLEWVSKLMIPGSSPRRRKKPL